MSRTAYAATIFAATTAVLSALSLVAPSSASASHCATESYTHNGSVMDVTFCDYTVTISYDKPRRVLRRHGVDPGTLLVDAHTSGGGMVTGSARIFKQGCGPLKYKVSGHMQGNRIVLFGKAPVRDDSCTVVRIRNDRLVFDPM